jgi:hypothetical protein
MNREESLRVINGFIKELDNPGGLPAPAAPLAAPKQEIRPAAVQTCCPKPPVSATPINAAPAPAPRPEAGLDSLIKDCAGFEIGSPAPAPAPSPAAATGLGALIQGCCGFEIGSTLPSEEKIAPPKNAAIAAPASNETGLNAIIKGCAGFEIGSSSCCPAPAPAQAQAQAPAVAPVAPPPLPVQQPDAETLAIRKAIERLNNKPLLASLLKYYASEAQKGCPSMMMLRSTRDNIMKTWPQLVFSPLISALEGAMG